MPRPKDPREAQLPHRLERPRRLPIHRIARQGRALEGALPAVRHRLGGGLVAEPVTDPVGVSRVDDRLHAGADDVAELGEEGAGVVARAGKFLVGGVGAFLVRALRPNRFHHSRRLEVVDVCFRGVGVVARGADVVDVEVGGLAEGAFDAVVADVVGVLAGGVAAGRGAGLQCGETLGVVGVEVASVLGGGNEGFVGIAVAEIDVGLFLELGVKPAVVDPESDYKLH